MFSLLKTSKKQQNPQSSPTLGHWLGCIVGAAWCAFFLISYATGQVDLLLAQDFVLFPLFAGLFLFVLVSHAILHPVCFQSNEHGSSFAEIISWQKTSTSSWIGAAILLLPLGAAWWLGPDGYSYEAMMRRSADLSQPPPVVNSGIHFDKETLQRQYPRNANGYRAMPLLPLMSAAHHESARKILTEEPIVLEGQLAAWPQQEQEETPSPVVEKLLIYQLMISCCAADARPLTAEMHLEESWQGDARGEWAKVHGTLFFIEDAQSKYWRPVIKVNSIEAIDAPNNPFLQ